MDTDTDMDEVLERIARSLAAGQNGWPLTAPRQAFHRVGDLVVTGEVGFAGLPLVEFVPLQGVPPGRYPVHQHVVESGPDEGGPDGGGPDEGGPDEGGAPSSWVNVTIVPLAGPRVIAKALEAGRTEDPIGDHQPFGPEAALWDEAASELAWSDGFAERARSALAAAAAAGRVPNVLAVPAPSGTARCASSSPPAATTRNRPG
ncbi:hypothetical protein AB0O31_30195 [Kitasatospora cineracea]|uniref:hypothetical protein n=1 Tax=Kitasatospora cineracea TaxID=88074 RepID=UPI003438E01A